MAKRDPVKMKKRRQQQVRRQLTAIFAVVLAAFLVILFITSRRGRRPGETQNAVTPSAQTESACAGALGVRLGGPSKYKGILVEKPYIGDAVRKIEPEDIRLANRLMFAAEAVLMAVITILWIAVILLT